MTVRVIGEPFRPWQALAAHETEQVGYTGSAGATAVFVGTMRDVNEDDTVHSMYLEHYPGMTEQTLERLCEDAKDRHGLTDVLLIHRVGHLMPGDPIVLVATWSSHRKAAFEASREIMEYLKQQAPFWKKEQLAEGARWVEENTPGY